MSQKAARCVLRLRQSACDVAVRAQSTAAAAQPAAEAVTGWDAARPYSDIPGPKPLPVLGNVWRFMPVVGKYHGLGFDELIEALHAEYGPVCKLSGMLKPDMLFLNGADIAQSVFRNEGPWPHREVARSFDHFIRDIRKDYAPSLTVSQGKEWHDFRTAVNQVMMQPRHTLQYVEVFDNVSQDFVDRMRLIRTPHGKMPADFSKEVAKWSLESIACVALDTRLGLLEKNLDPASDAAIMMAAISGAFDGVFNLDIKPSLWKWVSTPAYKKFINSMNTFTELSAKYVQKAVTRLQTLSREELEKGTRSVLEKLLLNTEDPRKAVSMAMDMLIAVDTAAAVMTVILYQLAINPDKQAKMQEELDRVVPDKSKTFHKEQMEELKYLRACIKESMRMMPIIPGNFRDTGRDQVIGGYQVPKGTSTAMTLATSTSEKYFPKADQFLPERWLQGNSDLKGSDPFAFLPFGFGPRMCVGKRFAHLELESLTAKVFRNFTLEWNQPPAKTKVVTMLKFQTPLEFTVKDRP